MTVDRRTFVKGALGASGAVLLGGMGQAAAGASTNAANLALPPPANPAESTSSS
jgi:hypothetical protein